MQNKYSEDDRVTKLQVHRFVSRFQQTGPVEDCQNIKSGYFKKRLDFIKRKRTSHCRFGVNLIVEIHYHFFVN